MATRESRTASDLCSKLAEARAGREVRGDVLAARPHTLGTLDED